MSQPELMVTAGAIVALRLFDVAYAIDLTRAETLLAEQARTARRSQLSATPPKAMAFGVPPVAIALDPVILVAGWHARWRRPQRGGCTTSAR